MEVKKESLRYKRDLIQKRVPNEFIRHPDAYNIGCYRKYRELGDHINWEGKRITKNKNWKFEINISDKLIIEVSYRFHKLFKKINNSLYILSLKEDWDDAGSKGYLKDTFYSTGKFLVKYFNWVWDEFRMIPDPPEILPGPDGSIDLLWQNTKYDLLINCKESPINLATFYGDDKKITKIEGQFDTSNPSLGVFLCLLSSK